MNQFRLLRADEIEVRISTVGEKGITLLLYKTARTDANLLDEVYGVDGWQNDFSLIDGVLFGAIGVKAGNEWIWKRDAGVESYTEKEKGRASDAFKRAGFKWGIGRELYSAPFIFIPSSKCKIDEKNGKKVCYDNFEVLRIEYDASGDICDLHIQNSKTKDLIYSWRSGSPAAQSPVKDKVDLSAPMKSVDDLKCECCHKIISPYTNEAGKVTGVNKLISASKEKYGKILCVKCAQEQNNAN